MKKTLIALATIAATSASFAQVTITGEIAYGYKASFNAPKATSNQLAITDALAGGWAGNAIGNSSGFGVDTSTLKFSATEDIGDGYKVAAEMNLDANGSGATATSGDTSLKLTTPYGRLSLQAYKPTDYLSGGVSGVGGVGMDDKVFGARKLRDAISFDTKVGPVYVGFSHLEQGSADTVATGAGLGYGVGAQGAATVVGQRVNSYSATYVGSAVIANLNYVSYDNRTQNTDKSYKDVVRAAASYDLGVAKFGAGVAQITVMSGATVKDALVSVSAPVGSWTLGANYAYSVVADSTILGAGVVDQSRSGYSLKASYALSKRTAFVAGHADWSPSAFAASRNTETTLLLSHTF